MDAPRITKRKLDDAIDLLHFSVSDKPPPTKRQNTSVYSTVPSKSKATPRPSSSFSTPALTSFLAKTRHKSRPSLHFTFDPSKSTTALYKPGSITDFLARLQTFKLSTYTSRHTPIDSVTAARCGWINDGKEKMRCEMCLATWVVAVPTKSTSREAAKALAEKQGQMLVSMHQHSCPWRKRQCDPSIYRLPLKSPAVMIADILSRASDISPLSQGISITHPLTQFQLQNVTSRVLAKAQGNLSSTQQDAFPAPPTFNSSPSEIPSSPPVAEDSEMRESSLPPSLPPPSPPSIEAIVIAAFGWQLVPPTPPTTFTPRASISRAGSRAPLSRAGSATPSSRGSSVAPSVDAMGVDGPSAKSHVGFSVLSRTQSTPTVLRTSVGATRGNYTPGTNGATPTGTSASRTPGGQLKQEPTMVTCHLCQRRVGLWAFMPSSSPVFNPAASSPLPPSSPIRPTSPILPSSPFLPPSSPGTETSTSTTRPTPRHFNVLKEHRPHCPYVVKSHQPGSVSIASAVVGGNQHRRSASVPSIANILSFNGSSTGASAGSESTARASLDARSGSAVAGQPIEGWRAILNVVSRAYVRRSTSTSSLASQFSFSMVEHPSFDLDADQGPSGALGGVPHGMPDGGSQGGAEMEIEEQNNEMEVLIEDVKARGGRDLLAYVKKLLR